MSSEGEAGRKVVVNETGRRDVAPSKEDLKRIRKNVQMEEEERIKSDEK